MILIDAYVHVYQGGQAIVGQVTPGGSQKNSEVQPHAIAPSPIAPMRGENTERKALPVSSDGERPVQDARRSIARRTEGQPKRL
jgi:hypothetical protein